MLSLRKARPADAALLHDMGNASYRHHFTHLWNHPDELETFLVQEYSLPSLSQSLGNDLSCWFIASNPEPVGFAKVTWHSPLDDNGAAGTLLHKLYLLPGETGKGQGEAIISQLMAMARQRGESRFWLEVLAENRGAYRFYRRLGFRHLRDELFSTARQQSQIHIMAQAL